MSSPVLSLFSAALGQSRRVRNIYGQIEWVEVGNTSQVIGWVFLSLYLLFGGLSFVISSKNSQRGSRTTLELSLFTAGFIALLSIIWNRQGWPIQNLAVVFIFFLCTLAARRSLVSPKLPTMLARLSFATMATVVIFALINPEYSLTPCREDKCTEFGFLLNSFFPHENFLAMFLIASAPILYFLANPRIKVLAYATCSVLIYLTGSRVAYLALIIFGLVFLIRQTKILPFAIPMGMVFSAIVFVIVRGTDLTDRGLIYAALWYELDGKFILGNGPLTLETALADGKLPGFLPSHEHGFAPHVITNFGLLVFLALLVYAIAAVVNLVKSQNDKKFLLLVAPLAVLFITAGTETPLLISAAGPFSWTWYLFVSSAQSKGSLFERKDP